jgi:hypothetical protein
MARPFSGLRPLSFPIAKRGCKTENNGYITNMLKPVFSLISRLAF